jgi:hypothetical protein
MNSAQTPHSRQQELHDALHHVNEQLTAGKIAAGAARGILFCLTETLGTLIGDPDLPQHVRSGYEGLLETAREINLKLKG